MRILKPARSYQQRLFIEANIEVEGHPALRPSQMVPYPPPAAQQIPRSATDPDVEGFSFKNVLLALECIPQCSDICTVAQIMELWDRGANPCMSGWVAGVARIPCSQLDSLPSGKWRSPAEKDRVKLQINPGASLPPSCNDVLC